MSEERVEPCRHDYEEITTVGIFGQTLTMTCTKGCGRQLSLLLDQESYWREKIAGELAGYLDGYLEDFGDDQESAVTVQATGAAFRTAMKVAQGKTFPTNAERIARGLTP